MSSESDTDADVYTADDRQHVELHERPHLSIGEVLTLLQEEFPDVTISKIRFLESQGLLDPERTPSGYRQFSQADIVRLRWILTQQRDHFLPLKIIKTRLEGGELDTAIAAVNEAVSNRMREVRAATIAAEKAKAQAASEASSQRTDTRSAVSERASFSRTSETTEPSRAGPDAAEDSSPATDLFTSSPISVRMTGPELCGATGVTMEQLADLEHYDLIKASGSSSSPTYDEKAFEVAQIAAKFLARGIEARHLRMFRVAAEHEAALLSQLASPFATKGTAAGNRAAKELLEELAGHGEALRRSMLRRALADFDR